MSEEKTGKAISKEHAEQIWEAILTAAEKGSLDATIAASELINARRRLDEQITRSVQTETDSAILQQKSECT